MTFVARWVGKNVPEELADSLCRRVKMGARGSSRNGKVMMHWNKNVNKCSWLNRNNILENSWKN
jgi:hypothetical protein